MLGVGGFALAAWALPQQVNAKNPTLGFARQTEPVTVSDSTYDDGPSGPWTSVVEVTVKVPRGERGVLEIQGGTGTASCNNNPYGMASCKSRTTLDGQPVDW